MKNSRTLLDLGASPNYKDAKNLTPLYYSVGGGVTNSSSSSSSSNSPNTANSVQSADVELCQMLLYERAMLGAQDLQGWKEVHQVRFRLGKSD